MLPITEAIADSRMVIVERAAHLANVEQPQRITELILAHLGARADAHREGD